MQRDPKRALVARWSPPVAWMAVIFGFSSLTGSELSPVSILSTYGHLGEYAILGALLFVAARATWGDGRGALFAVAVASAYGVTDELHQFFTPGRTPDPADWLADTVGAALAVAILLVGRALVARRKGLSER